MRIGYEELTILNEIYKGDLSMRDMADLIDASLGKVQAVCAFLEKHELVRNNYDPETGEGRKAKGRKITDKGWSVLHKNGLIKNQRSLT